MKFSNIENNFTYPVSKDLNHPGKTEQKQKGFPSSWAGLNEQFIVQTRSNAQTADWQM